jgi:hypothetical protein
MKIFKILYLILAVAVISSFSTAAVAEAASIKVVSVKVIKKKNDWRAKLTKEQIREKENYAKTVKIYVKKEIDNVEYLITYGAGFRLANGYIVTNEHVVSNGGTYRVEELSYEISLYVPYGWLYVYQ